MIFKKIILFPVLFMLMLFFTGCPYGYKYNEGKFPSDPVNFSKLNSIYDDYNMTSPVIEGERFLYFSSNRDSYGGEFDIIGDHLHILWSRDRGTLEINNTTSGWRDYRYADTLFSRMNTSYNEYGPYSLPYITYAGNGIYNYTDMIVFSNDASGSLDLNLVWFKGEGENPAPGDGHYGGPEPISFLNSAHNDAYLAFYGPGFVIYDYGTNHDKITEALFCSDRGGDFDIYQVNVPNYLTVLDFLRSDTLVAINPVDVLNSDYQDKCPYVDGELIVFASDRPGGLGGFDLYYSRRIGNNWSQPVNFGERINSAYDEYRPILAFYYEFDKDLMLFSSNRPGGKGGYDLYYVGIPRMIEGN
jgi:hypothetical protein